MATRTPSAAALGTFTKQPHFRILQWTAYIESDNLPIISVPQIIL